MTDLPMELTMLLWASILYVAQVLVAALAADVQNGVAWGLGNREDIPVLPGWGGRAKRAYVNMGENLLPFACLVLIAFSLGARLILAYNRTAWTKIPIVIQSPTLSLRQPGES